MVCGGDTTLNNSAVKNTIKSEYSRILSQTNFALRFSKGKMRADSQEHLVLSKNLTALINKVSYSIYIKPSQK